MKRLLILSCSAKKDENPDLIPAIDRYKSPAFYITRKWKNFATGADLEIWILSAKYGLISANAPIKFYDSKLSPARADKLKKFINAQANNLFRDTFGFGKFEEQPTSVFCFLSKVYLTTLEDFLSRFENVQIATGAPGIKGKLLKEWLTQSIV